MKLLDSLDHTTSCTGHRRSEIQILVDYFTAWNDRDAETILGLLADDATYEGPAGGNELGSLVLRRQGRHHRPDP